MNRQWRMQRTSVCRRAARIFLLLLAVPALLCACGAGEDLQESAGPAGKLSVVTTLFPYYDFTRQIAGDLVELSMVIPAGMDSHSFEPTPADIRRIQNADVLICNGGEMERWVMQVLSSLDAPPMTVVTMMDCVDVVEEEVVEGMEVHGGEHHGSRDGGGAPGALSERAGEIEYDEHIWTSPVNAVKIAGQIGAALEKADPKNAAVYEAGTSGYQKKLEDLDGEFRRVLRESRRDLLIMGDKFPLRYFADEYGLSYRAAFTGCSADTEPSARTIAYLIDKVRQEQIPAVYYLELSSPRVAEIIGEETGAKPLLFHSCHNVTRREFEAGVTYLDLMEKNVENLREGLCK